VAVAWREVTWYSKLAAVFVFGCALWLGWYFGSAYQAAVDQEQQALATIDALADVLPGRRRVGAAQTFTHPDVRVSSPAAGVLVTSPLTVRGEARRWYFEAEFPVALYDSSGQLLAQAPARAGSDWMTEAFVPFEVTLQFSAPTTPLGVLVLRKSNPSDLRFFDDEFILPVRFSVTGDQRE
jgi:hypothetical protein